MAVDVNQDKKGIVRTSAGEKATVAVAVATLIVSLTPTQASVRVMTLMTFVAIRVVETPIDHLVMDNPVMGQEIIRQTRNFQ